MAFHDGQLVDLVGQYHVELVYLVFQAVAQHVEVDCVADCYVGEVVKERGVGEPGVPGEYGVCGCAAYRQAGAKEVADAFLQGFFVAAVVDGEFYLGAWHDDLCHRAIGFELF